MKAPDYLSFFGLKDHPFRLTPDTAYYFPARSHDEAFQIIKYGIVRGEGFMVLTGEPGVGKTLLLRILFKELPPEKETAVILSPTLTPQELLLAILEDLGVKISDAPQHKEHLIRIFREYLLSIAAQGKTLLLVIDEAQNLPTESLEELRLLSNLETEDKKLVQILLVGQPGLEEKLKRPELKQLLQRITIQERLSPLDIQETQEYITFRWNKAGGAKLRLERGALKLLYQASEGIPRNINKIMDRAVLFAAAEGKREISTDIMKNALESLKISDNKKIRPKVVVYLPVLILLFLSIFLFFWWFK